MKRWQKLSGVGIFVIFAFVTLGYWVILPRLLHHQVEKAVRESCETCDFEIGDLSFGFLPGEVYLDNPRIRAGREGVTVTRALAKKVTASISPIRLAIGILHFSKLRFEGLSVEITEGDGEDPPEPPEPEEESLFDFRVEETEVVDAAFAYVRDYRGTKSRIALSKIDVTVDGLGTTDDLRGERTTGRATALLEKSGKVELEVSAFVFREPQRIDVNLRVRDQDLSDLVFFEKNDGLLLKGRLDEGKGRVRLRGRELESWVFASYHDFDVIFEKTVDRSAALAFFMNLGRNLVMDDRNDDEALRDQTRWVKLTREPKESLVGFILRGLRDAALAIAQSGREVYRVEPKK